MMVMIFCINQNTMYKDANLSKVQFRDPPFSMEELWIYIDEQLKLNATLYKSFEHTESTVL